MHTRQNIDGAEMWAMKMAVLTIYGVQGQQFGRKGNANYDDPDHIDSPLK